MRFSDGMIGALLVILAALGAACGGSNADTGGSGGSGGTGATGGATGTGTGTGGGATSTGTGTGGSLPTGDCAGDADCGGGTCAELAPGGWKTCLSFLDEATMCTPQPDVPDECCASADCQNGGKCYSFPSLHECGPTPANFNACITDVCASDAECNGPGLCAPAGAFGYPVRSCIAAFCHTNADCTAKPGGFCAPVRWSCCDAPLGVACIYPGGCRDDQDCTSDGSKHCEIDSSAGAGVCVDGPATCPA